MNSLNRTSTVTAAITPSVAINESGPVAVATGASVTATEPVTILPASTVDQVSAKVVIKYVDGTERTVEQATSQPQMSVIDVNNQKEISQIVVIPLVKMTMNDLNKPTTGLINQTVIASVSGTELLRKNTESLVTFVNGLSSYGSSLLFINMDKLEEGYTGQQRITVTSQILLKIPDVGNREAPVTVQVDVNIVKPALPPTPTPTPIPSPSPQQAPPPAQPTVTITPAPLPQPVPPPQAPTVINQYFSLSGSSDSSVLYIRAAYYDRLSDGTVHMRGDTVTVSILGTSYTWSGTGQVVQELRPNPLSPGGYTISGKANGVEMKQMYIVVDGGRVEIRDYSVSPSSGARDSSRTLSGRLVVAGTNVGFWCPPLAPILRPSQAFVDAYYAQNGKASYLPSSAEGFDLILSGALTPSSPMTMSGKPDGFFQLSFGGDRIEYSTSWGRVWTNPPKGTWTFYVILDAHSPLNQWGHWNPPLPEYPTVVIPFTVVIS